MTAPNTIVGLIDRFERNREAYRSGQYNEAQLRQEFINPFFIALGWDVYNTKGYAEAYKEVIHEDALSVGGKHEAPDYCFRIGGLRKFFVEAKKPSVKIKEDVGPAFQLRRYAWSAKLPLSILTDFEEFAVYDCRMKPVQTDAPAKARVQYVTYTDYLEKWNDIASVFSQEAILQGSFDRYAQSTKAKRGTTEVDDAFLQEIESWRSLLARNIALRNPRLSTRELNSSVQRTIDRIIFLRICEDRGIELYGNLMKLQNGTGVYARLREIYNRADERYNSGLFHFQPEKDRPEPPDELTPRLTIDDKPLKDIIKHLYYPDSPYEFSVLPADILGQVYEQFLGKVIRLTSGHHAVVEDKPEVKKAGGVYYTPTYIVDYIVKNTLGKLLEGKTPKQAEKLRILDPACGSGSFLIGAYQCLLDWHLTYYITHSPEDLAKKRNPPVYQPPIPQSEIRNPKSGSEPVWRLTTSERKRILLTNIYGVDIDPQAVEVTKLSLLLKVLEGESQQSIQNQLQLFHQRALPDLAQNIKCGNSLIGPDFYQGKQLTLIDEEERYRINAFDWNAEFPEIMKDGGFDAVIGNPPYVRQESISDLKDYFAKNYEAFHGMADLYAYFMEKALALLREGGLFSYIVSSSFLRATYGEPLRRTLEKHSAVVRIVDFGGLPVFANAKDTYVCIPLLAKGAKYSRVEVAKIDSLQNRNLAEHVTEHHFTIPPQRLSAQAWALKSDEEAQVFGKVMKAGQPLGEYVQRRMFYGLKTGLNKAFEITAEQRACLVKGFPGSEAIVKPFLGGQNIRRYSIKDEGRHLILIPCGWTREQMAQQSGKALLDVSERGAWSWFSDMHPTIAAHLRQFVEALRQRQDQGDYWWELRPCDYYNYLDRPKIIFPDICKHPRFYLDQAGVYIANTAYCLGIDDVYVLGVLNSRLFWFAISNISIPFGVRAGQYRYRLIYQYMEKVPIRVIDFSSSTDKARHDRMVELVERMLALHKQLDAATTAHDKTVIQRQIDATDDEIDRLVYDLYGLTEDEIRLVEESTRK